MNAEPRTHASVTDASEREPKQPQIRASAASQDALARARARDTALRWRNRLALLGLGGPALLWYAVFMVGPLFAMFYLSTQDWNGLLDDRHFTGLKNYTRFFSDPTLLIAIKNSAIQLAFVLLVMVPASFLLGYFLSLRPRGYRLLSILFFTPALMSASARAMMFLGIYAPDGIINSVLRAVGLAGLTRLWIADNTTALGAIIAVDLWSGIGFTAVVFAARLSAIPQELYEAADIDGARQWHKIWQIAYPITRDFVGITAMLQFIWTLGGAANVLLITRGGPGNASVTLGFMLYAEAFQSQHLGYSQAIGVFIFVVGLLGMFLIRRAFRPSY